MLEKSIENENAAFLLKQCGFYASSVNRSYYSVYQHILSLYEPDKDETDAEGSHIKTINGFCRTFSDFKFRTMLISEIQELKKLRKQADYEEKSINDKQAEAAFKKCQSIKQKIEVNK